MFTGSAAVAATLLATPMIVRWVWRGFVARCKAVDDWCGKWIERAEAWSKT